MGRLNKALDRIKARELSKNVATRQMHPGGTKTPLSDVATEPELKFPKDIKTVRLNTELLERSRIITDKIDPAIRTSYKTLRTRILQRMRANAWQSIAVTSATQGDGKTVTAINLAISLAGDVNHNVCLVDLDLRHSSIADYLGLRINQGISDCLYRGAPLKDALIKPDVERLVLLPNRRTESQSSELLSSPRMQEITRQLIQDPDRIVVFDTPPILAADDMLAFAPFVDAALFVACEGLTLRTDVMKARELLENVNIIGTLLNHTDEKTAAYY